MRNLIVLIVVALALVDSSDSCKCAEPTKGEKVCASNGQTYDSGCLLFCDSMYRNESESCLTQVADGECGSLVCNCTDTCNYVCASNGQTYGNDCTLECAQRLNPSLIKIKDGRCSICACTMDYQPVCGSDDVVYSNECALKCQQERDNDLVKVSDGECNDGD